VNAYLLRPFAQTLQVIETFYPWSFLYHFEAKYTRFPRLFVVLDSHLLSNAVEIKPIDSIRFDSLLIHFWASIFLNVKTAWMKVARVTSISVTAAFFVIP
jgi:hypothetical protein